jgi:primosomal protein N'
MTASLFATPAAPVARVALPVPIDRLFDYALPPALADAARPGCRVLVPLRDRRVAGVIVERAASPAFAGPLRPVERLLDPEPVLSATLLDMLREAAAEYLCPIGIAVATALPAGSTPRLVRGFALTARGRAAVAGGALRGEAGRIAAELAGAPRTAVWLRARAGAGSDLDALLARL